MLMFSVEQAGKDGENRLLARREVFRMFCKLGDRRFFGIEMVRASWLFFRKEHEVDNFQDAGGVDNKERDKPSSLPILSRTPERNALPDNRPEHKRDEDGRNEYWSEYV